jgi:hypothetical protein
VKRDENIVRRQAKTLQQFWQGSMETKGKESDSGDLCKSVSTICFGVCTRSV